MARLVQRSLDVWQVRSSSVSLILIVVVAVLTVSGGNSKHAEAGPRKAQTSKIAPKPVAAHAPAKRSKPKAGIFKRMVQKLLRSGSGTKEQGAVTPAKALSEHIVASPLAKLLDVGVVLQSGANLEPKLREAVQGLLGTRVQDTYRYRIAMLEGEIRRITIEERIPGQVHYNDRIFEVVGEGRLRRVYP